MSETQWIVKRLRDIAGIGIVNARTDTKTLNDAADLLEELDERISIMSETEFATVANFMPQWVCIIDTAPQTYPEPLMPVIIAYRYQSGEQAVDIGWWCFDHWNRCIRAMHDGEQVFAWCKLPCVPTL